MFCWIQKIIPLTHPRLNFTKISILPSQLFFGTGHGARVVFKHEPTGAPYVRLDVAAPLQLRHVKVERLLVVRVELSEQPLHVSVPEVPFVRGKKLQTRHRLLQPLVNSDKPASTRNVHVLDHIRFRITCIF